MRISKEPSSIQTIVEQKQLEKVESFDSLDSLVTKDARCTSEIKSRIAMTEAALNNNRKVFTRKSDLTSRKKPVNCYFWSIAFYCAENRTLRTMHQKYLKSFECSAGEGWRRSIGPVV